MPAVLASRRLVFSPFVATDLDLLMELHSDPEIMRYLSIDGRPWSREVIVGKLSDFIAEHAARGHSKGNPLSQVANLRSILPAIR
jgi:hypothetical protein